MARSMRPGVHSRLVFCVFMALACPASADEIWIAPTLQQDTGGLGLGSNVAWPVSVVGVSRFAWGIPGNLQIFQNARIVLIPHAPGGTATLNVIVCAAQNGQAATASCAGPFTHAFIGVANQLVEVDISADLAPKIGAAGLNHLAVFAYTTPTTLTDHMAGLRFAYGATAPAGLATLGANTFSGAQTAPMFIGDGTNVSNVNANLLDGLDSTAFATTVHGHDVTQITNASRLAGGNTFTGAQIVNGGNLDLDASTATTGNITKDGLLFLHDAGTDADTFLGKNAGNLATVGNNNTAIGSEALLSNTTGSFNTASGTRALRSNTGGAFNTAIGDEALSSNTTGFSNAALGQQALLFNTTGSTNTASGVGALLANTTGSANTGVGGFALESNSIGHFNTAIGYGALLASTGESNVAVGHSAGTLATSGSFNIYLGAQVGGVAGEERTMYLGRVGLQTKTVIAGVRGTAVAGGEMVVIDANGRLGSSPLVTPGSNTFTGTQTINGGNLDLDNSTGTAGVITKNGARFLHDFGGINSTFLGVNAGNFATTAFGDNTGIGWSALSNLTTGQGNTAVGSRAMLANTTGFQNVAVGRFALTNNTTGGDNTAIGDGALNSNGGGSSNTGVGAIALGQNSTGFNNTAIGDGALAQVSSGTNNVGVGHIAGLGVTTGSNSIYIGSGVTGLAAESNTIRLGLVGQQTAAFVAGIRGTAVAGGEMVVIDANGRLGSTAVVTPSSNTVGSAQVIDTSIAPVDVSFNFAGSSSKGGAALDLACAACVGSAEVSFGFATPLANTFSGTQTINAGNIDLDASTATVGNLMKNGVRFLHNFSSSTFLGLSAGNFTMTGAGNTGIGFNALAGNTTGVGNTAIGSSALDANNTGAANTAVGVSALGVNTSGDSNSAVGNSSLSANTFGERNAAIGASALVNNSVGSNNVAVGYNAGALQTAGSNNIYLGANVTGVAGEISTMYLGDVGTQIRTFIAGVRGIPTGIPNAVPVMIDSAGQLGTINSSRRFKEDIRDMADSSRRLYQLRPVTFRYTQAYKDGSKPINYGLVAEEVAEVFPELAVRSLDGEIETVHYETLNVLLLNELQAQQRRIEKLEQQLEALLKASTENH